MAHVQVIKKSFTNDETGKVAEYERLAITATISGVPHTLEVKLSNAELLAAKMLLSSEEKLSVASGKSGGNVKTERVQDGADEFFSKKNSGRTASDDINLFDEE